jgi:thymidine kinase
MFLEPRYGGQRSGWIEVITGCMFSGKTEELLRRLRRSNFAGQRIIIFKPATDDRYSSSEVVSHDSTSMSSLVIKESRTILEHAQQYQVIGIDEGQFFDDELIAISEKLALLGKRVIIAGLDLDYKGVPFGPIPNLMAIAEYVTKVHAICSHCGNLATHSYRISEEGTRVLVGEKDKYEPRCRHCYAMGNILNLRIKKDS